jgi:hypothetical protein
LRQRNSATATRKSHGQRRARAPTTQPQWGGGAGGAALVAGGLALAGDEVAGGSGAVTAALAAGARGDPASGAQPAGRASSQPRMASTLAL